MRIRLARPASSLDDVRSRVETVVASLPVQPEVVEGKMGDGVPCIDLLCSIRLVLASASGAPEQASLLEAQVVPVIDAMSIAPRDAHRYK